MIKKAMACVALAACAVSASGQVVETNPLCIAAITEGYAVINSGIKGQTRSQEEIAILQNSIAAEYTMMKKWEEKYNSYLKTAQGYATSLKASMGIYAEGVRTLQYLWQIHKAIGDNPQGAFATFSMNNLYMETVTEMVSVFTLLKNAVAKGGEQNMLTGSERSKTLWELEDKLSAFSHKLQLLYISIRHYRMADVWNRATTGMVERDKSSVAQQSLSHWRRYAREVAQYSR